MGDWKSSGETWRGTGCRSRVAFAGAAREPNSVARSLATRSEVASESSGSSGVARMVGRRVSGDCRPWWYSPGGCCARGGDMGGSGTPGGSCGWGPVAGSPGGPRGGAAFWPPIGGRGWVLPLGGGETITGRLGTSRGAALASLRVTSPSLERSAAKVAFIQRDSCLVVKVMRDCWAKLSRASCISSARW